MKYEIEKYKLNVERQSIKLQQELELTRLGNPSGPKVSCKQKELLGGNFTNSNEVWASSCLAEC